VSGGMSRRRAAIVLAILGAAMLVVLLLVSISGSPQGPSGLGASGSSAALPTGSGSASSASDGSSSSGATVSTPSIPAPTKTPTPIPTVLDEDTHSRNDLTLAVASDLSGIDPNVTPDMKLATLKGHLSPAAESQMRAVFAQTNWSALPASYLRTATVKRQTVLDVAGLPVGQVAVRADVTLNETHDNGEKFSLFGAESWTMVIARQGTDWILVSVTKDQ
jgi:hypothetical protein